MRQVTVGELFCDEKMEKALNDSNTNYDKAQKYAQEIRNFCTVINALKSKVYQINNLLPVLNNEFSVAVSTIVNNIRRFGTNFSTFSSDEKENVMRVAQLAQTIKIVIDTPLINQQGGVTSEAEKLTESKQVILDNQYG